MTVPHTLRLAATVLLISTATLAGCASTATSSPYAPLAETARDPAKAQRLTMQAAEILQSDPVQAERLLREALTADVLFGPAHNNLGVVELQKGHYYEAASEFE